MLLGSQLLSVNFSHVINANMISTGVTVSKKYSADEGINPDVVLVGIGVETTEIIVCGRSRIICINVLNEYWFSRDRWSCKEVWVRVINVVGVSVRIILDNTRLSL